MVAVKPGPIVCFDELQPLLEMPGQRQPAVVQMVEYPKAHRPLLALSLRAERSNLGPLAFDVARLLRRYAPRNDIHAAASIASAIFSAVIRVGKLVLAHGTAGNSEASTTRRPLTPRTRP
jgi:hypothetical protein